MEDISFVVKGTCILDSVNLEVGEREFVSLLGSSGAGKSTTLKVAAGILSQTGGHVFIDDKPVDTVPTHRRGVSVVFQDVRLFPHMSVGENVAYSLRVKGVNKSERMKKADYYLRLVHLEGFGERRVDELSGGQQQRVALARSVAGNPNVLFLDEPFSGLDEELRDDMRSTVRHIHDELGLTTVMITHDADEALMMSDRIAYLSKGRIVQFDSPANLYANPTTSEVAACFGDCLSIAGTVHAGVFCVPGFSCETHSCPDGPAVAILRRRGLSLTRGKQGACVVGSSFRGGRYYTTVEIEEKDYSLFTADHFNQGDVVEFKVERSCMFVFPTGI